MADIRGVRIQSSILEQFVKPLDKIETENEQADRIEGKYLARATTPMRAIRSFCVQCQGVKPKAVAHCVSIKCPLHPFRSGKNTLHPLHKIKEKL